MISEVLSLALALAGRGTDIAAALEHVRRVTLRRAVLCVIPDFRDLVWTSR